MDQKEAFEAWWQDNRPSCWHADWYEKMMRDLAESAWQASAATVKESLTVHSDPIAWAVITKDGDCRIWFRDECRARKWIDDVGIDQGQLIALSPLPPSP